MHTYTPANSICDSSVTSLLSIPCSLVEVVSRAPAKGGKGLNDFSFGAFTGRFQSDGTESMAVKGLKIEPFSASEQIHGALVSM